MPYTSYYDGNQGAKRQQAREFNTRLFVKELLDKDSTLSREEVVHALRDYVEAALAEGNGTPLYDVCDYVGSNNYDALTRSREVRRRQPVVVDVTERREAAKKVIANVLQSVILPSGRSLYDSTREEIIEFNGNLKGLIDKLKQGQTPRQAGITTLGEIAPINLDDLGLQS